MRPRCNPLLSHDHTSMLRSRDNNLTVSMKTEITPSFFGQTTVAERNNGFSSSKFLFSVVELTLITVYAEGQE